MPKIMNMEGTRPPTGASPTQPYKCGQNVKVNVNTKTVPGRPPCFLTLILTLNILTAFIRLGRAGPVRGRVPSILLFDFISGIVPSILFLFDLKKLLTRARQ
jgi:hypothetical protein